MKSSFHLYTNCSQLPIISFMEEYISDVYFEMFYLLESSPMVIICGTVIVSNSNQFLLQFFVLLLAEIGNIDQEVQKYNTPGFIGCLSRVQFNQIAPLKAALKPNPSSQVNVQGEFVESNCGASPLTIPPMPAATDPWHFGSGKRRQYLK